MAGSSLFQYKGYSARPWYSVEDGAFFGILLGIRDCIMFESDNEADLEERFHKAVDGYLEFCAEIGKEPQKQMTAKANKKESFEHYLGLFPESGLDLDPEQAREERLE